jgi:small subunit ribosomal protein S5
MAECNVAKFGRQRQQEDNSPYEDDVVKVYRCSTVVKGGRRFCFAGVVVVGDRKGQVGIGYGKANEVPPAVEKGIKEARRCVEKVNLWGTTVPHEVIGRFGATKVVIIPARKGTGVIASAAVRSVLELAGVHDVRTKIHGSTCAKNVVKATLNGLRMLRSREEIEALRGVPIAAKAQG